MRTLTLTVLASLAIAAGVAAGRVQDVCGPFTDVSPALCPYVLELYYLGITAGTSPTTYSPDATMTRGQAAVFVSKGVNQAIARSSRRAALGQWWTTKTVDAMGITSIPGIQTIRSDGTDLWISKPLLGSVTRVRASDGRVVDTWTGLYGATDVLPAMGRVFVTGNYSKTIYAIDPTQPPAPPAIVASGLPNNVHGIAFDGTRLWTTNLGSISILYPGNTFPWNASTITEGFTQPAGIVFDGQNLWVTDQGAGTLLRLDTDGTVIQTVPVGSDPGAVVFDGANLWITLLHSDAVVVVSAADGSIRTTLTGNGLHVPNDIAFDGERILVTSFYEALSLWRAADLAPLGTLSTIPHLGPYAVCSDGLNFWIAFGGSEELGRF